MVAQMAWYHAACSRISRVHRHVGKGLHGHSMEGHGRKTKLCGRNRGFRRRIFLFCHGIQREWRHFLRLFWRSGSVMAARAIPSCWCLTTFVRHCFSVSCTLRRLWLTVAIREKGKPLGGTRGTLPKYGRLPVYTSIHTLNYKVSLPASHTTDWQTMQALTWLRKPTTA